MSEKELESLIAEIREEKQIPPFFSDKGIVSIINEGIASLDLRVIGANYIDDNVARGLLKNFVFYAYHKRANEFFISYNGDIVAWQLSQGVAT